MTYTIENGAQQHLEYLTLLMCKVTGNGPYQEKYRKILSSIETVESEAYVTIGGYDALCIYATPRKDGESRLHDVLEDRKKVVAQIDMDVSYHPVHLVRKAACSHCKPKDKPFLLVVFVYGINDPDSFDLNVANDLPGVEIYHCINISDRVLLYYTDNIGNAMVDVDRVEESKAARKMYSTVSVPLNEEGSIDSSALDKLKNHPKDLIYDNQKYGTFAINIRGSIKNPQKWKNVYKDLKENFSAISYFSNYGEDDFVLSFCIDGDDLNRLLTHFMNKSKNISEACWDIHTEFQIKRDRPTGDNEQVETNELLDLEYENFRRYLDKSNNKKAWMYAYKELFNVHKNLDRHPILKGPAYMLYDCLLIANHYFYALPDDVEEKYKNTDLISQSQERIERFIRCWSHITDQLTRNDDVVFYGIGRIPAIAATLPENLLEFYHGFLRKLAEYLKYVDIKLGHISYEKDFQYGFLLSPELNQRMRVSELFVVPYSKRIPKDEFNMESVAWPNKQVYIIQLPSDDVFRPMDCFLPLAHECLHKFGERFRFRHNRLRYMAQFVGASLASALGYGNKTELSAGISNQIMKIIVRRKNEKLIDNNPYMQQAQEHLGDILYDIMSENGWIKLYKFIQEKYNVRADYLFYPETIRKRERAKARYFDKDVLSDKLFLKSPLMKECTYYFRECYADFMAIYILGVTPKEAIQSFFLQEFRVMKDKVRSATEWKHILSFCQRIVVILTAYKKCNLGSICAADIGKVLNDINFNIGNTNIVNFITDYYIAMTDNNIAPPEMEEYNQEGESILSPGNSNTALRYVVDYLEAVVKHAKEILCANPEIRVLEKDLKEHFDNFIRKEQLFDSKFIGIIQDNRDRIEHDVRELRKQILCVGEKEWGIT